MRSLSRSDLVFLSKFTLDTSLCPQVTRDAKAVEMCGALKNIVAIAAGMMDGMNVGNNAKAAIIRLGMIEMVNFVR